ncbi:unnamed protein product [Cylindrotheca closterium]|uniref:Mitochondrial carrier protein n=1 Tax=Cylindrotheca closterium TaxID=2856 RepID=A0AAD2FIX6_9STRA|nr:unnamed protein product [Cylindrotheca closterium]
MSDSSISSDDTQTKLLRNSLLAGSFAGMASTLVCYPFDVLRIKIQSSAFDKTSVGVIGTFRQTIQSGGFRALYVGLALPFGAQAIYKGTIFTVNNLTLEALLDFHNKGRQSHQGEYQLTSTDRFICGFTGGAINGGLFVTPVEYVRNRLISEQGKSKAAKGTTISVIRSTLINNGLSGLWRGMTSTVLRDSIGCGLYFVTMASAQEILSPNEKPSFQIVLLSGALSGIAFWVWALPIDTMKTWIQNGTAKNMREAVVLASRKGATGSMLALTRGWEVAYGRGAPSAAITVATYTSTYHYLMN